MPGGGECHGRYFRGTSFWGPVNVNVTLRPSPMSDLSLPRPPAEEVMELWATPMCDHPGSGLGAGLVPYRALDGMAASLSPCPRHVPAFPVNVHHPGAFPHRQPAGSLAVPGLANVKPVPREDDRSPRCPSC
ncbi:hypothetical protein KVR01_002976 [Diaporthe batatas]|uniref:uncharacterized protein n=1 Tax=Diaporthe batatas TaxID=748121 RepID=UPI001D047268|nr:uncharacterized protein KVR01_002976 [Diaporthe batatas]KAG8167287.1 hypothetical protein KVR01_002976 [Diaporthe batatas]